MTSSDSEKWVKENLIVSNIPQPSVVVFYNIPYKCVQMRSEGIHDFVCSKTRGCRWCHHEQTSTIQAICTENTKGKDIQDGPHSEHKTTFSSTFPSYKCDVSLNLPGLKWYIRSSTEGAEFSVNHLCKLTNAGLASVTKCDWQGYCHHMKKLKMHTIKRMASVLMYGYDYDIQSTLQGFVWRRRVWVIWQ